MIFIFNVLTDVPHMHAILETWIFLQKFAWSQDKRPQNSNVQSQYLDGWMQISLSSERFPQIDPEVHHSRI